MTSTPMPPGRGNAATPATPTAPGTLSLHEKATGPHGVQDYARRMAFLTELDSQTWISRYSAGEQLGNPEAVQTVAGYLAWLRRVHAAWAVVPMPSVAQAEDVWTFSALPPSALDVAGWLESDVREAALATGGPHTGAARPGPAAPAAAGPHLEAAREDVDAAYVAGAVYVTITLAQEAAVLAADVEHLSATAARVELPQRYLRHCLHVAALRGPMRRELAAWAASAGPEAAERVVLAARMLTDQLVAGFNGTGRPGW